MKNNTTMNKHKRERYASRRKGKVDSKTTSRRTKLQLARSALEKDRDTESIQEPFQILDAKGRVKGKDPQIPTDKLLRGYQNMVLTRMLDERLISLQRQGRMGTYVSCSGQEASQIGAVMALSSEKDWLFPMYRDMGMIIQSGVTLKQLLNRMFGNAEDEAMGRDLPNLYSWKSKKIVSFAAPIASHVPLAVGFAIAANYKKDTSVTLSTFGDGATSSSEFHVGMNFAGVYRAPTVFVCENNQYAISVPVSRQTATQSIAIKAIAYGFEGVRVDGNDLFAVYSVVRRAVEKARNGGGPTLVECLTYRMGPHSTADDWKKYRSGEEVENWKKRDPLVRLKEYLIRERGVWSEDKEKELRASIELQISEAISTGEKVSGPEVKTLFEDVYSNETWNLKEQQKEISV